MFVSQHRRKAFFVVATSRNIAGVRITYLAAYLPKKTVDDDIT